MDKNDLRHYAESIIASIEKADEEFGTSYTSRPEGYKGLMEAYELARAYRAYRAYRAEHDETQLTPANLNDLGFDISIVGKFDGKGPMREIWQAELSGGQYLIIDEDGDVCEIKPAKVKTLGQLRKLLGVAGIQLGSDSCKG